MNTLKEADPDRRCFRMVGGVLIERTVKEVLPSLEENMEQVGVVSVSLLRPYFILAVKTNRIIKNSNGRERKGNQCIQRET